MYIKNREDRPLIEVYGVEVYRITANGTVRVGEFSRKQIAAIKDFVSKSDHYVTWEEWKPFLRSVKKVRPLLQSKIETHSQEKKKCRSPSQRRPRLKRPSPIRPTRPRLVSQTRFTKS